MATNELPVALNLESWYSIVGDLWRCLEYFNKIVATGCIKSMPEGFKLLERAPGVSVDEIKAATEGRLVVEGDIPEDSDLAATSAI